MIFIEYPKCSTCKKAKQFLINNNMSFISRDIVNDTPTYDELKLWIAKSNLDIKKFFNTSGLKYKELNLKDKLTTMNDDEKIKLLASNGMLIKRPLLIDDNIVLVGFNKEKWSVLK
ncbi:MAG: arsenate reductase family protein [Bacilli bacterium]